MDISAPYLLFLGDVPDDLAAKMAHGIVEWRREACVGQHRLTGCRADCGLPDMSLSEAQTAGARTLVIGVVNPGGKLPENWIDSIVAALDTGFDVASGLHMRLGDVQTIAEAADRNGRNLFEVRHTAERFDTGKGTRRPGRRLLTVGTDCAVGKKFAALAIAREMRDRGMDADFRATGQTGILISGSGVAVDAVVADFISGAAEWLTPAAKPNHWDVVEGQGSLFHPSFAGVTLGLMHGTQPDAFIVCHEPTRTNMRNVSHPIPDISEVIDLTMRCGRLTNPGIRCTGIALNTAAIDDRQARRLLAELTERYELPATDPVRYGVATLIDHLIAEFPD
jgi:uncharacterized NAD-dependent epimerase/dehydratase family protein